MGAALIDNLPMEGGGSVTIIPAPGAAAAAPAPRLRPRGTGRTTERRAPTMPIPRRTRRSTPPATCRRLPSPRRLRLLAGPRPSKFVRRLPFLLLCGPSARGTRRGAGPRAPGVLALPRRVEHRPAVVPVFLRRGRDGPVHSDPEHRREAQYRRPLLRTDIRRPGAVGERVRAPSLRDGPDLR